MASTLVRGDRGPGVRELQEWLELHGAGVEIDGIFGAATEAAVRAFQATRPVPTAELGSVGPATWGLLTDPIARAVAPDDRAHPAISQARQAVVVYAQQHLAQHPREVGGPNLGPWVRLYCNGFDGESWLWCAAFVHFVVKQVWDHRIECTMNPFPLLDTFPEYCSCDRMAQHAIQTHRMITAAEVLAGASILPGYVFLIPKSKGDWVHAGIVTGVGKDTVTTIEGNTSAAGSRNGDRVAARTRAIGKLDFIRV